MTVLKRTEVVIILVMAFAMFIFGYWTGNHFAQMDAYRMACKLGVKATEGDHAAIKVVDGLRELQPELDRTSLTQHFYEVLQTYDQRRSLPKEPIPGQ